jgi:hypothetical protein
MAQEAGRPPPSPLQLWPRHRAAPAENNWQAMQASTAARWEGRRWAKARIAVGGRRGGGAAGGAPLGCVW